MTGLNALTLVTADMRSALAFWLVPGFEIAYGGADATFTSLRVGGGTFVNLSGAEPNAEPGGRWGRCVIHVADPDNVHGAFVKAGWVPSTQPRDAEWGERYFHITDADGNEISFARPLAP